MGERRRQAPEPEEHSMFPRLIFVSLDISLISSITSSRGLNNGSVPSSWLVAFELLSLEVSSSSFTRSSVTHYSFRNSRLRGLRWPLRSHLLVC